jgi:hypothetical protein
MLHPQSVIAVAALAAVLLLAQAPLAAAPGAAKPFDVMQGAWSGSGSITLGSGDKERIRCRANYTVDGNQVRQELRCASDSYKFEMQNDLTYNDGQVNGIWNEVTRRASGRIYGRFAAGRIEAMAETSGFAATFVLTTRGDQQTVKIDSKSRDISNVSISLRRSN